MTAEAAAVMLEERARKETVPCAVICTICDGRADKGDLTLYSDFSGVGLYLQKDPLFLVAPWSSSEWSSY
jgi:hypothetical protein